jgi:hypothetical protein
MRWLFGDKPVVFASMTANPSGPANGVAGP